MNLLKDLGMGLWCPFGVECYFVGGFGYGCLMDLWLSLSVARSVVQSCVTVFDGAPESAQAASNDDAAAR